MTLPTGGAIICLGPSGLASARRLAEVLPDASVHGLARRVADADVPFDDTMEHVAALFAAGVPVVGVCAAGILIRAVAPLLDDKWNEAAVVAVAEDGSSVVPLLGGHHGANALAARCAGILGGHAALTTASDVRFGVALDDPPPGWRLVGAEAAKDVMAAILAGEAVRLQCDAGDAAWLTGSGLPLDDAGARAVVVTDRTDATGDVVLHPPVLALGVGCERGCDPEELRQLVRETLEQAGLSEGAIACVASLDLKADEVAMLALADDLGVPFVVFDGARLEQETPRLKTPSDVVFAEVGCHGVSEGAALAAAGAEATLIVPKAKSSRATCAVARAPSDIDARAVGHVPGRLTLVGLGPGAAEMRTPAASRAIAQATDVVGYGYYLDLAGPLMRGKTRHDFPLGEETERCRAALDLAGAGHTVALLCSGDPGVYAMASLVYELLDLENVASWRGVGIDVVPGVSALQIAAARVGAPIGHDFCAISLSDLLTPRAVVLQRVRAAALGDFAIAFYNPVSHCRRDLLAEARTVLLDHRPGDTPVVIGRLLGREGESLRHVTLDTLAVDDVDMMSVVLVGASATRRIRHRGADAIYTPRGYAKKREN
ncbi:MAG: precorrin-3B C(17)-methyltransferase [Rhodospirillales bacterium]|nr:precorrin-3B C(17)-methyltransferase [Rhodospirillales bacterium]